MADDDAPLRKRVEQLRAVPKPNLDQLEDLGKRIEEMSSKSTELKCKLDETRRKIAELKQTAQDVDKTDKCPMCGTPGTVWKQAKLAEINKMLIQQAEIELATEDELDKVRSKLAPAREEKDRLTAAIREYENASAEAEKLEAGLKRKELQMASVKAALASFPEDLEAKWKEADEAVHRLSDELHETNQRLNAAASQYEAALRARERSRTEAKSLLEAQRAKAEAEAVAAVVRVLEEIQEKAAETAIKGLLERVNTIAASVLDAPLTYRDGEFGKVVRGAWVPLSVFSGTEQAVAYAAIASALAAESPIKLVLLDEMGRLDANNKRKFIANMIELVNKGAIDQFVGIDTDPTLYRDGLDVTLIVTEK